MIVERTYERIDEVTKLKYGFVTGAAGRGKTELIKEIQRRNPRWGLSVATTGVAAVNLGANVTTLHALLECSCLEDFRLAFKSNSMHRALSTVREGYERLVIDECSMLLAEIFHLVYTACKDVNLGLILVGDFAQLPPVVRTDDKNTPPPWLVFQAKLWPEFTNGTTATNGKNIIKLLINHRTTDENFILFLNALRAGDGELAERLELAAGIKRSHTKRNEFDETFKGPTLVGKKDIRDQINNQRYLTCRGSEITYKKEFFGRQRPEWIQLPQDVRLKLGSRVMITNNKYGSSPASKFLFYANGTTGVITDLGRDSVTILSDSSGRDVTVKYHREDNSRWVLEPGWQGNSRWQEEPNWQGEPRWVKIEATASVEYLPVCLAWSVTTHKAQGLSIPKVQIFVDDPMFRSSAGNSLLYVAASRCKTGSGLYLSGSSRLRDVCRIDPEIAIWV